MNLKIVIALGHVMLLAACTQDVVLYPRGGGAQAIGTLGPGNEIVVTLAGDTYTGNYVRAVSAGAAISGYRVTPMAMGSNYHTALLIGKSGNIRCEFMSTRARGGNGVCVDGAGLTYDMLIK